MTTSANRSMFRRLLRRLLFANRGRLFVILLALSAGAAVSAALLNLQVDAKRRIASEFRAFGSNIIVAPRGSDAHGLDCSVYEKIPRKNGAEDVAKAALLYGLAEVAPWDQASGTADSHPHAAAVIVGYGYYGHGLSDFFGGSVVAETPSHMTVIGIGGSTCELGEQIANRLRVHVGEFLELHSASSRVLCAIERINRYGGVEDNQIFIFLGAAQYLLSQPGRVSIIAINAAGKPGEIKKFVAQLQNLSPDVDVRPLLQFSDAQAKIYSRISGLLTAATALILALTALCVMAAMTNIAAERRNDVGMMKAIGGSARRVLNLFLTEAVILGLVGGLIGAAAGIALSVALGKAVFGVAAAPRLIVYPISVSLTVIVAILGAYPLRRLVNVRPATIFRGEA